MAEEQCLCLVTDEKLCVIKLSNLKELEDDVVKHWSRLPSPVFDFVLDLPHLEMCPFVFDSKIYMMPMLLHPPHASCAKDLDPVPVYEFRFEERKIVKSESLDPAPFPLYLSFIANTPGSGDVYFYTDLRARVKDSPLFYVLSPGSRVWKSLNPPSNFRGLPMLMSTFVLNNNFFVSSFEEEPYLARFDSIRKSWKVMPSYMDNLPNFVCKRADKSKGRSMMFFPLISVTPPGLLGSGSINNYTVCLMHEVDSHGTPMVKLFAFLVNQHNGRIALYQNLYVCFEGIQPKYHGSPRFNLVDLGNGKLCAILCTKKIVSGPPHFSFSVVLSISVFTLSLVKDLPDLKLLVSPMKKDFLEVTSLKKSVYTIKDASMSNIVRHAFVWPPTKEEGFQHRAIL